VTKPDIIYDDVLSRDVTTLPDVDCYCFSPPCQPFSTAGKGEGEADSRGRLVMQSLNVIKATQPRLAVMENVATMLTRHKKTTMKVIKAWKSLGYNVTGKVLKTEEHNLPHRRARLFIVGIRRDSVKRHMKWPKPLPLKVSAMSLLDRSDHKPGNSARMPESKMAFKRVKAAMKKVIESGVTPRKQFVAIDCDCGVKFQTHAVDLLPCLTATRTASFGWWLTPVGRRINLREVFGFQGFTDQDYKKFTKISDVSTRAMGHMLGNGLSLNVYRRVIAAALFSAGLVSKMPNMNNANDKA
jgi:DNA (cytosine-5)-methyltransferase 1